jgi:hypothetical protein
LKGLIHYPLASIKLYGGYGKGNVPIAWSLLCPIQPMFTDENESRKSKAARLSSRDSADSKPTKSKAFRISSSYYKKNQSKDWFFVV